MSAVVEMKVDSSSRARPSVATRFAISLLVKVTRMMFRKRGSFSTDAPSITIDDAFGDAELCSLNVPGFTDSGMTALLKTSLRIGMSESNGPFKRSK